jgi:tRNA/tmRNA/rRNA uracil-C5-methylase (TrmA/RlmC/RlmD family)
METVINKGLTLSKDTARQKVEPVCTYFGTCSGCLYQNIHYAEELKIKEANLKTLLQANLDLDDKVFAPIVSSPQEYNYRHRLDLALYKLKTGEVLIGFTPESKRGVMPIDACAIAQSEISDFIPELKDQVLKMLPPKYHVANVVVKTGEGKKVLWGGIGKRSTRLNEADYFWVTIGKRKIFYSLDTFFQANTSILPILFDKISALDIWGEKPVFFDLYGGVGFFTLGLIDKIERAILIEECVSSLKLAYYNISYHKLENVEIVKGKVEEVLPQKLEEAKGENKIAFIDPPRSGLSESAVKILTQTKDLNHLLYLSCNPEALTRDLSAFIQEKWEIKKVIPFDFFPKTKHLETLVLLKP